MKQRQLRKAINAKRQTVPPTPPSLPRWLPRLWTDPEDGNIYIGRNPQCRGRELSFRITNEPPYLEFA